MSPVEEILAESPFSNGARARAALQRVAGVLDDHRLATLKMLLKQTPDPDSAAAGLDRFLAQGELAVSAVSSSNYLLHAALTVFAHSNYLGEALIRHPELLAWAMDRERFFRPLSAEELRTELGWIPAKADDDQAALTLARFKRMQLLRIALRDLLGAATLAEVTLELSNLADALIEGAHDHLRQQLAVRHGRPLSPADNGPIESRFVALAVGKLGGRELNYSSDIDLMYLHTGEGTTSGPIPIPNSELFKQLASRMTNLLSRMTPEGFCYRVDLRLRPDGAAGELVLPLVGAVRYYHGRARDWELQMLIKARPAAGHLRLGHRFLSLIEGRIYRTTTNFTTIEKVSESRDRIQEKLRRQGKSETDVKLARGGIRDIEFLVQCLQRLWGGKDPFVRSGGTLFSLHRLSEKGYLSMPDYARLNAAYQYLRTLEHRLQMLDNRQMHSLPSRQADRDLLERKMHGISYSLSSADSLERQVQMHFRKTTEVYERIIHSQAPTDRIPEELPTTAEYGARGDGEIDPSWRGQLRHIERFSPELASAFEALPLRRGSKAFGHLLDKLVLLPELLEELENRPRLLRLVGDLVEHSPYLAEHLVRYPHDIRELVGVADAAEPASEVRLEQSTIADLDLRAEPLQIFDEDIDWNEKSMRLRRFYRREMLRIQADSIFLGRPIFATLGRTSDLAEWVVRSAYRIALETVCRSTGRAEPCSTMQTIALGRLGMREFDIGSDADVVFVIPDDCIDERPWWKQVVERMIDIISSYTSEGMIFSVDARLRPMGRDGELVETESRYMTYFAAQAEAWEALTYMKARTVAGDLTHGGRFLAKLQEVGWKRYGLNTDLAKLLHTMRTRLEKEQGALKPLKAGAGGYYDIDFILMYLRLRGAGVFYESLTTPRRIEVVRALGGLSEEQASFLSRTATFYRALGHAVRVSSGQSASKIPTAPAQQEVLGELVSRWSPIRPDAQPLAALARQVRDQTRKLYRQVLRS